MEFPDPSGSFYGRIPVMEPRPLGISPGSGGSGSGGNGGHSVYSSSQRRRLMSSPPTGTLLMAQFNAALDGEASGSSTSSSSSGGLDLGLDESQHRHSRYRVHPEALPTPNRLGRLLLLPPMGSPAATDDQVLIMDGVLVDNIGSGTRSGARRPASFVDNIGSGTRRSVSFSDLAFVSSGSPVSSGGGGRRGSNGQFAQGREEPRGMQAMNPTFSEVVSRSSRPVAGATNMQGRPIAPPHPPPSLPGPIPFLPTAAPRGVGAGAAVTIRPPPPASHFTPARVSVPAAKPGPSAPKQPETKAPQPPPPTPTFSWPPTTEEEAAITEKLYGPSSSGRPRLPVFKDICPED